MAIAIRVDVSADIGTGHFVRCLTLANALRARRHRVRFVSRNVPDYLARSVVEGGHELVVLRTPNDDWQHEGLAHSGWLGTSQSSDASATVHALAGTKWEWLVVDHYAIDARWERLVSPHVGKLFVIDDIGDRTHECAMLLDQNLHDETDSRYCGKVPKGCRLLLGPRYALLREEFRTLRRNPRPREGRVRRILVFLGGIDARNYTERAIEAVASIENRTFDTDVVIGWEHPQRELIERLCRQNNFCCHVQTASIGMLMASADLAIGAAGAASWERCCVGLPTLIVSVADNQTSNALRLDRMGAGMYLGPIENVPAARVTAAIRTLLYDVPRVRALSERALSLVDGNGVERVCQTMESLSPKMISPLVAGA